MIAPMSAQEQRQSTKGVIRQAFRSIPYGMSVDATWLKDVKQLLWVETGFSTL